VSDGDVSYAHEKRGEGTNYVALARLFAMSGRWYMPRHERLRLYHSGDPRKLRANWGTLPEPPRPPEGFTDAQAEKAKLYMETRGWTLVNVRGEWVPQRLI
jgi:hypothetical protein